MVANCLIIRAMLEQNYGQYSQLSRGLHSRMEKLQFQIAT